MAAHKGSAASLLSDRCVHVHRHASRTRRRRAIAVHTRAARLPTTAARNGMFARTASQAAGLDTVLIRFDGHACRHAPEVHDGHRNTVDGRHVGPANIGRHATRALPSAGAAGRIGEDVDVCRYVDWTITDGPARCDVIGLHGRHALLAVTCMPIARRGRFFANLPSCVVGMEACGGAHY
jgi:hypothetical protein